VVRNGVAFRYASLSKGRSTEYLAAVADCARGETPRQVAKRTSTNKVLLNLVERGIESLQSEREQFFALADRLTKTRDPEEQATLKEALAKLTFGA